MNEEVQRRRGCVAPPKYPHQLTMGDQILEVNECPSKMVTDVVEAFGVHAWAERGRLQYLYPPDELPVILGEALDVIEAEMQRREAHIHKKAASGR
jgi:hypothetical protein